MYINFRYWYSSTIFGHGKLWKSTKLMMENYFCCIFVFVQTTFFGLRTFVASLILILSKNIMTTHRWSKFRWLSPNKATSQGMGRLEDKRTIISWRKHLLITSNWQGVGLLSRLMCKENKGYPVWTDGKPFVAQVTQNLIVMGGMCHNTQCIAPWCIWGCVATGQSAYDDPRPQPKARTTLPLEQWKKVDLSDEPTWTLMPPT